MDMKTRIIWAAAALFFAGLLQAQTLGQDARYCNPLPMEIGQGSASGDVSVFQWEGKYYMFCTGGGAWVSSDMLNWEYHYVAGVPVAPDVCPYNGKFYMTGNSSNVWVADNPLGPYEVLGQWKGTPDREHGWSQGFDPHIYVDENNQPYLFWPGMAISGIYSVKLDPKDITQFVGPVTHHFSFNPAHVWERQGEQNEFTDVAWIEGPWIYKYKGTYYLQYSASGTQWRTYAEGYYKAKKVQGPYEYAPNTVRVRPEQSPPPPHGRHRDRPGPRQHGHGPRRQHLAVLHGGPPQRRPAHRHGPRPGGQERQPHLQRHRHAPMGARCGEGSRPGRFRVHHRDPAQGDSGSIIVSIGKTTMSTGQGFPGEAKVASSAKPGRGPEYALDNSTATWWEPADDDASPVLTISLSPAVDRDRVQTFQVDGARLLFGSGARRRGAGGPGAGGPGAGGPGARGASSAPVYRYKIEVSMDGKDWRTALDQSANQVPRNVLFDEIAPVECRYVRLTLLDWPKSGPLSILDFSVFGRATGSSPSQVPVPTPLVMR